MPDGLALAAVAALACACGPLGVWVVTYRHAYASESLAHALLPGLLLAALLGLPLLVGAAAGALVSAAAIGWASRDERVGPDAGVAVAVTGLVGAGGLIAVAGDLEAHEVEEALFGRLDGLGSGDVTGAAVAALVVVTGLLVAHRRLMIGAFGSAPSPLRSAPAMIVLVLIGVATVAAAPVVGGLLAVALLVAPGAAALRVTRTIASAQAASIAIGAAAAAAGLFLAEATGWDAAACVALVAVLAYFATSVPAFAPK